MLIFLQMLAEPVNQSFFLFRAFHALTFNFIQREMNHVMMVQLLGETSSL